MYIPRSFDSAQSDTNLALNRLSSLLATSVCGQRLRLRAAVDRVGAGEGGDVAAPRSKLRGRDRASVSRTADRLEDRAGVDEDTLGAL
jgi:hypothetical protein